MSKRFLEHGKWRMIEVLKHPSILGDKMPTKFWPMIERMEFQSVKDFYYEHVTEEEIKKLERIKFKLDHWK
jgi:hypothetical protein